MGKAHDRGRAAHVLFHEEHARGRFDVQPAGVKAHAFADQRQMRAFGAPSHLKQAWRAGGGAADGVDHGEVLRQKVIAPDHGRLGVKAVSQSQKGGFQFFGAHVERWRVDKVTRQELTFGHGQQAGAVDALGGFQKRGFAGRFAGSIAVEAIRLQQEGKGGLFALGLCQLALQMPCSCGQACSRAGQIEAAPRAGFGAAHAGHGGLHRAIGIGEQA